MTNLIKKSISDFIEHEKVAGGGVRFAVTAGDNGTINLRTSITVHAFLRGTFDSEITLQVSPFRIPDVGGIPIWPLGDHINQPYGREIENRFAAHVLQMRVDDPELAQHLYGIMPGMFFYENGNPVFRERTDPLEEGVDSVLFYSDTPTLGVAGRKNLTGLKFGDSGLYGLVMPVVYLVGFRGPFSGTSEHTLMSAMGANLRVYLDRVAA